MPTTRAVLFDMGGTIITYRNFEQARRESMTEFARWFGIEDDMARVHQAFLQAAAEVWPLYTVTPYYLHSDLGKDLHPRPIGHALESGDRLLDVLDVVRRHEPVAALVQVSSIRLSDVRRVLEQDRDEILGR